jgi:hypothetical protein
VPLLVRHWARSQALQSDQHREMRERALQLARVLAWSQEVLWEQAMLEPLVARCRQDMTPFMRSA